ncbi:hypothetical protein BDV96DRAFT_571903 [Lophiotrema nucula]|uniref:Uncharacterized protein n=1 Tax=Lophiotrema nucula TaxID=690887 RepID=A0A6A5ZE40_9PLEO|nr:hypothetical protein BDV96DRAFT_571903 [Lophiotrema nucula]
MISNSTRSLLKVTHVPLEVSKKPNESGGAIFKAGFVRQLALQKGEVSSVLKSKSNVESDQKSKSSLSGLDILEKFEGAPLPIELPSPARFSKIPHSDLLAFGRALLSLRQERVKRLDPKLRNPQTDTIREDELSSTPSLATDLPKWTHLVNLTIAAVNAFTANGAISPMGMLNLERLEMTPAGIEKGELLATIPLAPMEKTSVVQQEWSVVNEEFTSIVTDSLENFSRTGVTENTELAQATASQNSHSNQFNITASASGGCGFVTGSVSTTFGNQDATSVSATDSRKHAVATTRESSSRVKQARKVTISTTSTKGSSETTTRTLENPSKTDVMRIDYLSMMRKWHVGLYRYGLRLTYDITVPEPGAAMRSSFRELERLQNKAATAFSFNLPVTEIDEQSYENLATTLGAQIPSPPIPATRFDQVSQQVQHGADNTGDIYANHVDFSVQEGYELTGVSLDLELSNLAQDRRFDVVGSSTNTWLHAGDPIATKRFELRGLVKADGTTDAFLAGARGNVSIAYMTGNFGNGLATWTFFQQRTNQNFTQWRSSVWSALYDAAQASYYADQANTQGKIATLQDKINNVDTLTLRREEHDEIMKCVLRWILGTNFDFVPPGVIDLYKTAAAAKDANGEPAGDLTHGVNFTGNSIDPSNGTADWSIMYQYEAVVNFINEAIEWENVVYFLYSYFWDIPTSWEFVRQIQHSDSTRQAFLRAGSARIVLTVRKGFERRWTQFAEHYNITNAFDPPPATDDDPYMTIAQQIQDYDNTNYPGIPPANPDGNGPVDDGTPQAGTTSTARIVPGDKATPVTIRVDSSKDFVVGATAVIDSWDSRVQERQVITDVPNESHITVQGLQYPHSPHPGPYPVYQASSKGVLIGEWYEYTPSKGTFIAVNSDLNDMV